MYEIGNLIENEFKTFRIVINWSKSLGFSLSLSEVILLRFAGKWENCMIVCAIV